MEPQLLPCPFCGSERIETERGVFDNNMHGYRVKCLNFRCGGGPDWCFDKAEAFAVWNTRTPAKEAKP